jgi:hypothetical protein
MIYFSNSHGTMQIPTSWKIEGDPTWVVARKVPRFEIQIIVKVAHMVRLFLFLFFEQFKTS